MPIFPLDIYIGNWQDESGGLYVLMEWADEAHKRAYATIMCPGYTYKSELFYDETDGSVSCTYFYSPGSTPSYGLKLTAYRAWMCLDLYTQGEPGGQYAMYASDLSQCPYQIPT